MSCPRKDLATSHNGLNQTVAKASVLQPNSKAHEASTQEAAARNRIRAQQPHWHQPIDHYQPAPPVPRLERQPKHFERPVPVVRKPERRPRRCLFKAQYQSIRSVDLIDEAKFRGLELFCQEKPYIVEVLLIDDEAYAELMDKLGNHHEAIEFAQGEVSHRNQELRRQRAITEAAKEQATREFSVKQQEKQQQKTRGETEKMAPGQVEEQEKTARVQEQERRQERADSGYLSELTTPPPVSHSSNGEQAKGKKHAHPGDEEEEAMPKKKNKPFSFKGTTKATMPVVKDGTLAKDVKRSRPSEEEEEAMPRKKNKLCSSKDATKVNLPMVKNVKRSRIAKTDPPPTALPRAMQARVNKKPSIEKKDTKTTDENKPAITKPAKGVALKAAQKKVSSPKPSYARRVTRSTYKEPEEEKMEDTDEESEEETDEDDFVVEDPAYTSKRKSKVGAMARSNLFAGMR